MNQTNKLLAIIIGLQALILLGQWTSGGRIGRAEAQIPDAGSQRERIAREVEQTNAKFDKLIALLESGKVQVKVVQEAPPQK